MGRSSFYAKKAATVLSSGQKIKSQPRVLPRMQQVDSGYIKSIGYDRRKKRLFISFYARNAQGNKMGYYDQVPEKVFREMLAAESPGIFQRTVLGPEYVWFYLDKNELN